jgi:hypothetical protein
MRESRQPVATKAEDIVGIRYQKMTGEGFMCPLVRSRVRDLATVL